MKFGLKLWSKNVNAVRFANKLYAQGEFDLIELYVVPGTEDTLSVWKGFQGPFMIHCAHSVHGFNLAKKDHERVNRDIFDQACFFADELNADTIVVHGGNDGELDETIRQLCGLKDERMRIENKPKFSLDGKICIGWSPEEIGRILDATPVRGMVFDLGHALYAANAVEAEPVTFMNQFLRFRPMIFHVGDGDASLKHDCHKSIGEGDFDLGRMLKVVHADAVLTVETPGNPNESLGYFRKDVGLLKALLVCENSTH